MLSISVDVDELVSKLNDIKEDGFETVCLVIDDDLYTKELIVRASGLELNETLDYGVIADIQDEI